VTDFVGAKKPQSAWEFRSALKSVQKTLSFPQNILFDLEIS